MSSQGCRGEPHSPLHFHTPHVFLQSSLPRIYLPKEDRGCPPPSTWRGQLIWSLKVYCKRNLALSFKNTYSTFPRSWQRNKKLSVEVSTQKSRGASCCVTRVGWELTLVSLRNFCEVTFHEHKSYSGHLSSFWPSNSSILLFYDWDFSTVSLWGWAGFASYYRSRKRSASLCPCPTCLGRVRHGSQSDTALSCGTTQGPWAVSEQDPVTVPTTISSLVLPILSTLWTVQCSSILFFFLMNSARVSSYCWLQRTFTGLTG